MVDEQQIANKKINKELKADFNARNKVIKLLLLGTGKAFYHYNIIPLVYIYTLYNINISVEEYIK